MKIDESWYIKPPRAALRTSAGGVIVRIEKGEALIALVEEQPYGVYILPKGGMEEGEDREKAARREIEEEAGLNNLQLIEYLGTRERLGFNKQKWITTHYFLFTTPQDQGKPTDKDHAYTCVWFSLDELPEMLWPEQRELLESCREKILSLLRRGSL